MGFVAFFLQRFSGLFVLGYLYLHLYDLRLLIAGPSAYQSLLQMTESIAFVPLYVILFGISIYHGANGVRLIANEFGYGVSKTKAFFWILIAGGVVLWFFASYTVANLLLRG